MTQKKQVYKCNVCGNIVEVLHEGIGQLVCCNQPMVLQDENTVDAALEKHVPVIDIKDIIATVIVGSVEHPMEESHYIEWIELVVDGVSYKKFLEPNEKPVVEFQLPAEFSKVYAREYCNLHGLWRSN